MKKKKESEDILKQFYSNLSLLSPESFFFNRQLTKLLLPYIQKFIKSGDKCDFGFRIKNESSCELTEANHFSDSILVPKTSLSRFKEDFNEADSIFDNCSKYNDYVKIFIKKNPIFSTFKKDFISHLYFQSSQRLIFLAICHLMKPNVVKKIILEQKKEQEEQNRWRVRNIFQKNLDDDDPASFLNTTMRIDDKKSGFYSNKTESSFSLLKDDEKQNKNVSNQKLGNGQKEVSFNEFTNSILVEEDTLNENESFLKNNEENQNNSNCLINEKDKSDENQETVKIENQLEDDITHNEKENQENKNISKNESETTLNPTENDKEQNEISVIKEGNELLILQSEEEQSSTLNDEIQNYSKNEKEKSIELDNQNYSNSESNEEANITDKNDQIAAQNEEFYPDQKEGNELKNDISKSESQNEEEEKCNLSNQKERSIDLSGNITNENSIRKDEHNSDQNEEITEDHDEISKSKSVDEYSLLKDEKNEFDSFLTECSKDELNFPKSDDGYSIQKDDQKRFNSSSILEEIKEASSLDQKVSFSMPRPNNHRKRFNESNLSISHDEKIFQLSNEKRIETSASTGIGEIQTGKEIIEYSEEESDFDLEFARSQVFDELSLSFFEMRTNVQGQITRGTEPLFERWSQISCCLFFEFVSCDLAFSSLKCDSSFAAKFEDFVRSLVQGFVSAEKQSYHDGVTSLLPVESKFFYVKSLATLDSINKASDDQTRKDDQNQVESNEFFIDDKLMFYHHRRGIQISATPKDSSAATDSIFNTTINTESQQTYSFDNQTTKSNDLVKISSQKVNKNENEFSVSKFMNPVLAAYRSMKDESVESFSMKIMLAKAVHSNAMKESRILFDVSEASPLISRALELRGVTPPRKPPDPSNYSPRRLRKSEKKFPQQIEKKPEKMPKINKSEVHSPRSKKKLSSQNHEEKLTSKPKIKVNHVNSKNSIQSSTGQNSIDDSYFTYNRKIKATKNEKKCKNKDDDKKNQIRFDPLQNGNDQISKEKKKPLKTSIRRVRLAESKGFVVREKAVEQHNRGVLNDYEVKKRAIYRDICSNEAKCAEEIEKYASNGKLIMHSNIGKSVLYDKLEKNMRNKQTNKSYDRLNGRKIVYGMEYDTDFSQLEGPIATAILEDGLF